MKQLRLTSSDGATAEITHHGAQLLSWKTGDGKERLFLSQAAEYADATPIRGGVPIIFPQFGGPQPLRHGFARNMEWQLAACADDAVTFELFDTTETRIRWPHSFRLEQTIALVDGHLEMKFTVKNRGDLPFDFTSALHTYLRVSDVAESVVKGLAGREFLDEELDVIRTESGEEIRFHGMVDRVYYGAGRNSVELVSPDCRYVVATEGFPDVVVWNPGEAAAAKLKDLEQDGYKKFVCVEAVAALPVVLQPGEEWAGRQTISVI